MYESKVIRKLSEPTRDEVKWAIYIARLTNDYFQWELRLSGCGPEVNST
jgi:hypothetical protein